MTRPLSDPPATDARAVDTPEAVGIEFPAQAWDRWDKPGAEGRVKIAYRRGQRFRLLELPAGFDEHQWCLRGHSGYVLSGEFVVLFADREAPCSPGMAFSIPDGEPHRSRGASNTETVVFVVDEDPR